MIEHLVKRLGRSVGIEISRYRPFADRRARWLLEREIATVIDVGANTGGYGSELRSFGYKGRIVSVEPLADAFAQLVERAASDLTWECHNVAAGDSDEEATINVASNVASSSLLVMRDEHRRGAPTVSYVAQERVRVCRLDSLGLDIQGPAMLKMDVQGYEAHVLAGATSALSAVALIECELSIAHLYEGQPSFWEMIDRLSNLDFEIVDLDPFFYDRDDGRVLAMDALFSRKR